MYNLPVVCYSHSSYNDIWDMHFGQLQKNLDLEKYSNYLFTDKVNKDIPDGTRVINYDDNLSYSKRLLHCLEKIDSEIILFQHEDMVLYDKVNVTIFNNVINFFNEYNMDYIKLLKGGHSEDIQLDDMPIENLHYIPHNGLSFAIQPTLWKTEKLIDICKNAGKSNLVGNVAVGDFEESASEYVNKSDIHGLYWYSSEPKRGMHHWDSSLYPHGNMIFKGKWVYSEYELELSKLHKEYGIDKNNRGTT